MGKGVVLRAMFCLLFLSPLERVRWDAQGMQRLEISLTNHVDTKNKEFLSALLVPEEMSV